MRCALKIVLFISLSITNNCFQNILLSAEHDPKGVQLSDGTWHLWDQAIRSGEANNIRKFVNFKHITDEIFENSETIWEQEIIEFAQSEGQLGSTENLINKKRKLNSSDIDNVDQYFYLEGLACITKFLLNDYMLRKEVELHRSLENKENRIKHVYSLLLSMNSFIYHLNRSTTNSITKYVDYYDTSDNFSSSEDRLDFIYAINAEIFDSGLFNAAGIFNREVRFDHLDKKIRDGSYSEFWEATYDAESAAFFSIYSKDPFRFNSHKVSARYIYLHCQKVAFISLIKSFCYGVHSVDVLKSNPLNMAYNNSAFYLNKGYTLPIDSLKKWNTFKINLVKKFHNNEKGFFFVEPLLFSLLNAAKNI